MASEERKEAFLRAWFDTPEGVHWAHGMSNEIEQNVSDCFDKAIAAWATPVAPVSPDATGKCEELVTVGYAPSEYDMGLDYQQLGISRLYPKSCASGAVAVVTRSQAVELLAAERADKRIWMEKAAIEAERVSKLEADNAAKDETLRKFGNVQKAYEEHIETIKADNAALTARVKTETELREDHQQRNKELEAKLAAAEKALEFYAKQVSGCRKIGADGDKFRASLDADGGATARAALGGKPS
nr:hypothetical protein [Ochrobactrum sp. UNC390CL2Tsu3S39]